MADGDFQRNSGEQSRDNRGPREGGGFRIRLSDNEMRSARALQEAFNLRSTVAVLGFAVRSLGQMLEDGQLDELVAQHRSQAPRGGRRGEGGRGRRFDDDRQGGGGRGSRPDPFARPAKPQPQEPDEVTEAEVTEADPVADAPQPEPSEGIDTPSADAVGSEDAKATEA